MIAIAVSKANKCHYCQQHHMAALQHYWKDEVRVEQLRQDYCTTKLSETDIMLCDMAWDVTTKPGDGVGEAHVSKLQDAGVTDREILDANLVTSYFNFVNRMVIGLGVPLEQDQGVGYNY